MTRLHIDQLLQWQFAELASFIMTLHYWLHFFRVFASERVCYVIMTSSVPSFLLVAALLSICFTTCIFAREASGNNRGQTLSSSSPASFPSFSSFRAHGISDRALQSAMERGHNSVTTYMANVLRQSWFQEENNAVAVCCICLLAMENKNNQWHCRTCCGMIHLDCIMQWCKKKTTCPLCRQAVSFSK
jgi:hypothetical protein